MGALMVLMTLIWFLMDPTLLWNVLDRSESKAKDVEHFETVDVSTLQINCLTHESNSLMGRVLFWWPSIPAAMLVMYRQVPDRGTRDRDDRQNLFNPGVVSSVIFPGLTSATKFCKTNFKSAQFANPFPGTLPIWSTSSISTKNTQSFNT